MVLIKVPAGAGVLSEGSASDKSASNITLSHSCWKIQLLRGCCTETSLTSLPYGAPHTDSSSEQAYEKTVSARQKLVFYNLIVEVTSHQFAVFIVRSKSLGPTH
jgi:hypothetical protein